MSCDFLILIQLWRTHALYHVFILYQNKVYGAGERPRLAGSEARLLKFKHVNIG